MKILSNNGGLFSTNAYLVVDEETKKAVLFDAPDHTVTPLLDEATQNGWEIAGLWLTHGHIDHVADHAVVAERFPNARVLIHSLDAHKLRQPSSFFQLPFTVTGREADHLLQDGEHLRIGSIDVNVIHTPGHSPGHVMFHIPAEKILIGGDVIIMGAVGRTDFPDCSYPELQASIRRIMRLGDETQLLPGHGMPSTLGEEKTSNEYVQEAMAART